MEDRVMDLLGEGEFAPAEAKSFRLCSCVRSFSGSFGEELLQL